MRILTIDFETRSADDLKSVGVYHYAADPSTDVLCLALKERGAEPVVWMPEERLTPEVRFAAQASGLPLVDTAAMLAMVEGADAIEAHNAGFELEIWRQVMAARRGFPMLPARKLRCTAARAVVAGFPRPLDQAGAAVLAGEWKDDKGSRLMLKMCKPRKPKRGEDPGAVYWHETPADLVRLAEYCCQDTRAQESLAMALPELPASEQALFLFDLAVNGRGVAVDLAAVDAISAAVEANADRLRTEFRGITGLDSPTQRDATLKLLQEMGVPISGLTARDVDDALTDDDAALLGGASGIDPKAAKVLEIRKSLSKSSLAKYQAMRRAVCPDGRLRGMFMYYGAATGRWAGRLVQPQNFPRGTFADVDGAIALFQAGDAESLEMMYDDLPIAASSCLRGMIVAAPGHDFVAADYSAIEGRVLAWLAGEETALDVYRSGRDPYKVAAAAIHHKTYDDVTKPERQIGKVAELACGYQGAVGAFQAMGRNFGLELPEEEVKEIVDKWRASRPRTVSWWYELENCAVAAIERPGDEFQAGPVSLSVMDRALLIRLPSGRCLYYRNPRQEEKEVPWGGKKMCVAHDGVDSYSRRWKTQYLYGGRIAENVTQAVARDILCRGMLAAEAAGYRIVMHVHDEAVAEVLEGFGGVEEFEKLLCAPIPWAPGLPLKAEGWRGKRYRK